MQSVYCLEVVTFEMRGGWRCSGCQKRLNGYTKSIQGESKASMLDNNCRSMSHQIGVKTPQIYENSKVKFIPCEEAAPLTKEMPAAHKRTKFVARLSHSYSVVSPTSMKCISPSKLFRPASPQNVKPSSSMKSILPSRQIGPSSPRSMKQKCVSPSRSDNQVLSLRPCAVASQKMIKVGDISMRPKVCSGATVPKFPQNTKRAVKQNDHLLQPKEEKVDIAARGKGNSRVDDQPRGGNAFYTSDANIGCQSERKSLNHNIDMPVVISSSVEYARRPPPAAICWSCEKKSRHLFETYCGFVMKAYIDDMMLLIYSSEVLPPDSQCG